MTKFSVTALVSAGVIAVAMTGYWVFRWSQGDSASSRHDPRTAGEMQFPGPGPLPYSSNDEEAMIRIIGVGEKIPDFTIEDVTTGKRWTRHSLLALKRPIVFLYGSIT